MMMIDKMRVERLRERYPIGSRIELVEMVDDPCPIEPGAKGELLYIDDTGTLFVSWDNGRRLGVVPGQDNFTVLPPGPPERGAPDAPGKARPRHKTGRSGQER